MNEKRYGFLAFVLSLTSLALFPLTFMLMTVKDGKKTSLELFFREIWESLAVFLWGWLPVLVLAVVSIIIVHRSQILFLKRTVRIISTLAILEGLLWLMLVIILLTLGSFHYA
jgi:hypothetical protein